MHTPLVDPMKGLHSDPYQAPYALRHISRLGGLPVATSVLRDRMNTEQMPGKPSSLTGRATYYTIPTSPALGRYIDLGEGISVFSVVLNNPERDLPLLGGDVVTLLSYAPQLDNLNPHDRKAQHNASLQRFAKVYREASSDTPKVGTTLLPTAFDRRWLCAVTHPLLAKRLAKECYGRGIPVWQASFDGDKLPLQREEIRTVAISSDPRLEDALGENFLIDVLLVPLTADAWAAIAPTD